MFNHPFDTKNSFPQPGSVYSSNEKVPLPSENSESMKALPDYIEQKKSDHGVTSNDAHLNSDPKLLKQFFYSNNSKPSLKIRMEGSHLVNSTITTSDGNGGVNSLHNTYSHTDFDFSLDVTDLISDIGNIDLNGEGKRIHSNTDSLFKAYVNDESSLKEFKIEKVISWDHDRLKESIKSLIFASGYKQDIEVTFKYKNNVLKVCNNDTLSKMVDNKFCDFLFNNLPFAKNAKENYGNKLQSTFSMSISAEEWLLNVGSSITEKAH